jgi:hypothetical protein
MSFETPTPVGAPVQVAGEKSGCPRCHKTFKSEKLLAIHLRRSACLAQQQEQAPVPAIMATPVKGEGVVMPAAATPVSVGTMATVAVAASPATAVAIPVHATPIIATAAAVVAMPSTPVSTHTPLMHTSNRSSNKKKRGPYMTKKRREAAARIYKEKGIIMKATDFVMPQTEEHANIVEEAVPTLSSYEASKYQPPASHTRSPYLSTTPASSQPQSRVRAHTVTYARTSQASVRTQVPRQMHDSEFHRGPTLTPRRSLCTGVLWSEEAAKQRQRAMQAPSSSSALPHTNTSTDIETQNNASEEGSTDSQPSTNAERRGQRREK